MKDRDYKSQELLRAGWEKMEGMRGWWYRPGAVSPPTDLDQAFDNERLFPEKVRIALQRKADSSTRPAGPWLSVDIETPSAEAPSSPLPRTYGGDFLRGRVLMIPYTDFLLTRTYGGDFLRGRENPLPLMGHSTLPINWVPGIPSAKMDDVYNYCFQEALDREIEYLKRVRAAIGNDMELKELISGKGRKDLRYRIVPIGVLGRLGLRDIDKA